MRRLSSTLLCFLIICGWSSWAFGFDEFDAEYAPSHLYWDFGDLHFEIKGRMRLGLHDLQGMGGPGYDSPTDTQTIGTRSPFVELDSFDLAFRLSWDQRFWLNTSVAFYTTGANLSTIYFEYRDEFGENWEHGAELGYLSPIIATDRKTMRYPLIATALWKNSEFHAAYGIAYRFTDRVRLGFLASVGMMRPLKSEPLHGSPTYKGSYSILSYGPAMAYSGNSVNGTALLRLSVYGLDIEGYGSVGNLSTNYGLDTLIADFPHYRMLHGFSSDAQEGLAYFAGVRLRYEWKGFHFMTEGAYSVEHLLRRAGFYAQAAYTLDREADWFHSLSMLVRYESTHVIDAEKPLNAQYAFRSPDIINAISWDYRIATLALHGKVFREFFSVRLEYSFIFEENAVPLLGLRGVDIDNNELLLQIEGRF